ncbi:MAG: hypothetical protein ACFFCQ_13965 [Promethearchaeota archaeon]
MSSPLEDIYAFLAFVRESGIPVLFRNYREKLSMDPSLVSAFLTAMISFARDAQLSNLKQVDMADLRFVFIEDDPVVFAALVSRFVSPLDLEFKLNTIKSLFFGEFNRETISDQAPDSNLFRGFTKIVDEIILGETRGIDPSLKAAVREAIDETMLDSGMTGIAVLSMTGNVIVNRFQDKKLLEGAIRFLDATYVGQIHGLKYMVLGAEDNSLAFLDSGQGIMLVGVAPADFDIDNLTISLKMISTRINIILGE